MSYIIDATYGRVKSYLQTIYGEQYEYKVSEYDRTFTIRQGSAAIHVTIEPWHEEDCVVRALAYVVMGAQVTPELSNFLLRENARMPIGGFGILFDNTITFSHAITGANLDLSELRTTVRHVAFMADEYDDYIRDLAGGFRAVDANALILSDPVEPRLKTPVKKKAPAPKKKTAARKKTPVKKTAVKKTAVKKAAKPVAAKKPVKKKSGKKEKVKSFSKGKKKIEKKKKSKKR